jgi:hypothetical protein
MRIKLKTNGQIGRMPIPAGSIIEIDDAQAKSMIERGLAESAEDTVAPVPSSPVGVIDATGRVKKLETDPGLEEFAKANATNAIAIVEATGNVERLQELAVVESKREQPRKTVLAAIDAQLIKIQEPVQ